MRTHRTTHETRTKDLPVTRVAATPTASDSDDERLRQRSRSYHASKAIASDPRCTIDASSDQQWRAMSDQGFRVQFCYPTKGGRPPSEHNTYSDFEAAYKYLEEDYGVKQEDIILYGQSVGSGPTVDLASRLPRLRAIVLHNPILSGLRVIYPVKRTYCSHNLELSDAFYCFKHAWITMLSLLEKIVTSLALSDSENADMRLSGKNFCMARIEELCANLGSLSCHDQIHNIIVFLRQSEGLSKHVDSFMQILSLVQFKDTPPFVLTPLLPDEMHEADFLRW
ncbi:hypothetical protein Fmac_019106 [Flemingia macrophylla]|uniref:Serine aminopeptidase S33 domain-containing protein n=1 Tax=Flemingia macrophylla TaxID=520843 RepID=A0ABD1M707_9FABA